MVAKNNNSCLSPGRNLKTNINNDYPMFLCTPKRLFKRNIYFAGFSTPQAVKKAKSTMVSESAHRFSSTYKFRLFNFIY